MVHLIFMILMTMSMSGSKSIFDFKEAADAKYWRVINDGVMGGLSRGEISVNDQGHGLYQGQVSLENNGGFSSVRHQFESMDVAAFETLTIRIKGDGKRYQLRVKTNASDRHAYITYFVTNGAWQTIEVRLSDMYPTFRGRQLNQPNFPKQRMEEIAFLIANKKAESFRLEIDSITLD